MLERVVFEVLASDSAVLALCPAARIKPFGDYQNLQLPYLMHGSISMQHSLTHREAPGLRLHEYQVSCFASTLDALISLRDAVIAALAGYHQDATFILRSAAFAGTATLSDQVSVKQCDILWRVGEQIA